MPPKSVGLERIWAYPGTLYLDLDELARVRGHDPADIRNNLLCLTRSLNPLWEDAVTMAVNAARPMLTPADQESIGLLIVATESSVDQGKAISTMARRHLGIQANCRNFEIKQACYGGTAAVMTAASWIISGLNDGKKALVICTDQSRHSLNEPYEYVMGAGAVAMIISDTPDLLAIEIDHNGYWTNDTFDTFRPTSRVETGNGEESLYCYLDALEGAYAHFLTKAGDIDPASYFAKHIYHVPFGGITFQAHRTLLRQWKRLNKSRARAHFVETSKPGLRYNAQMGGTYSGSTFLALMGMIDSCDDLHAGDRISMFSYGSGSCGEFYSGVVGTKARQVVAEAKLGDLIEQRHRLSVPEYEALENERFEHIDDGNFVPDLNALGGHYERAYEGKGWLILKGIQDHYRTYDWS